MPILNYEPPMELASWYTDVFLQVPFTSASEVSDFELTFI